MSPASRWPPSRGSSVPRSSSGSRRRSLSSSGLAVGAAASIRPRLIPGATLASRYALRIGITLLGARLTLGQLLATGAASIVGIVLVVGVALVLGTWLARRLAVVPPLSALITVGMAICGNSAILALSPIIGAKHRDTAYAVSTITIFGLIGVLLLPVVGRLFHMSDPVFGTWAGLAVNDTAQVVATGYAFSPAAGDVATVVKLTRNLAILPVLLGATWLVARSVSGEDGVASGPRAVPDGAREPRGAVVRDRVRRSGGSTLGRSAGRAAPGAAGRSPTCARRSAALLILVALAGVGMATDVRSLSAVGGRPFLLGGRRCGSSSGCSGCSSRRRSAASRPPSEDRAARP